MLMGRGYKGGIGTGYYGYRREGILGVTYMKAIFNNDEITHRTDSHLGFLTSYGEPSTRIRSMRLIHL